MLTLCYTFLLLTQSSKLLNLSIYEKKGVQRGYLALKNATKYELSYSAVVNSLLQGSTLKLNNFVIIDFFIKRYTEV